MKYFTIEELCKTKTGLKNVPNLQVIENLTSLVENLLDPIREAYGSPIIVTSGYRSPAVNRKVGGALNSNHTFGYAADIKCKDMAKVFNLVLESKLEFDELIWEYGDDKQPSWLHLAYRENKNRFKILKAVKDKKGKTVYLNLK